MCLVILDPGSLGGLDIPASPVYQDTLDSLAHQATQDIQESRDGLVFLASLAQAFPVGADTLVSQGSPDILALAVSVVGVAFLVSLVPAGGPAFLDTLDIVAFPDTAASQASQGSLDTLDSPAYQDTLVTAVSAVGAGCLAGLVSVDTLALLEWGSQLQRHIRLLQL